MKYVGYELYLDEPVKMGSQGDMANTDSLGYIAGSTIRGAFVNAFLKKYPEANDTQDIFVNTRFSDAYPMVAQKKLVPMPALFYANKYEYRSTLKKLSHTDKGVAIKVRSVLTDNKHQDSDQRLDMGCFGEFGSEDYVAYATKKCANLHINTTKSGMFRYEAIERGQTFYGYVACEDEEMAEKYHDLLSGKVFYLGGSRGSGYGRCHIVSVDDIVEYDIIRKWFPKRKDLSGKLCLYALSNLYMLDEYGKVTGNIDKEWLSEKLGIKITSQETASISVYQTSGFNNHWGAGNVQATAVGAGSFYVFTCEGTPNEKKVRELEESGLGNRKQEGFGRILVNPDFTQEKKRFSHHTQEDNGQKIELTPEDKDMVLLIQNHVNANRIETNITTMALAILDQMDEKEKEKLNNSQLSRLFTFLDNVLSSNIDPMMRVSEFMEKLKKQKDEGQRVEYKNINVRQTFNSQCIQLYGKKRSLEEMLLSDINIDTTKWHLWMDEDTVLPYTQTQMRLMLIREIAYAFVRQEGGKA